MAANHTVFLMVPMFAFLCSLFLFVTLSTVKKDKFLFAFMGLLGAYLTITLGSFLMRLELFPGSVFWYKLMLAGYGFVPYCYYNVAVRYLGLEYRRQRQFRFVFAVVGAALLVFTDLFTGTPVLHKGAGNWHIDYGYRWPLLLLAALALALVLPSIVRLYREARQDALKRSGFYAVTSGLLLLTAGLASHSLGAFHDFPTDTLACTANAFVIYYVLYKRRVSRLSYGLSRGALYFLWALFTFVLVAMSYETADGLLRAYLPRLLNDREIALALFFCAIALAAFLIISKMYGLLFEREKTLRSAKFREFSLAASKLLNPGDLVNALTDFLLAVLPSARAYVFLKNAESGRYVCAGRSVMLDRRMEFSADSRLAEWLREQTDIFQFSQIRQTVYYDMMSEHEKRLLNMFDTELLLPLNAEGNLLGFTLLSKKSDRKRYGGDDIALLASVLPVLSIALRNANLYEGINLEAQRDALTGFYNRRYFMEKLESDLGRSNGGALSVVLFNLDDFGLYNEFYGGDELDPMLVQFADALKSCAKANVTVARYACHEFAVCLPYADAAAAEKYALKVKAKLAEHLAVSSDPTMFLAFSAGICSSPSAEGNAALLMKRASFAVRRAKGDGRNRVVTYSPHLFGDGADQKDRATILQEYSSTIYALTAAIDTKDHYTFNHSLSVSHYAASLALSAGMDEETVEAVRQAGLLHDIGKIAIPDAILSKAGRLTDIEFAIMRKHVERSVEMIRHLPSLSYVTPLVLGHHERYDGRGYPRAIAGDSIPIGARCLAIADSFDAMISQRSYKKPMPLEDALEEIRLNLGKQFDPSLGRLFISLVESGNLNVACY
ncbi:MAG: HD domain-containing phosphohydrolase [Clostridiaceae bacterium]|nr:diguanylate cyclase [Eubacteriales bacterium]